MQTGSISELIFSSKTEIFFIFTSSLAALKLCVSPFMLMVIFTSLFLDIVGYFVVKYI
nr:MAG TPA: hypothetical protein [Caudoviricetes sp.]